MEQSCIQFSVYLIHTMHCKNSTVPLLNLQQGEAQWAVCVCVCTRARARAQIYRILKFGIGSFGLEFIPLTEHSTLHPSYDTFACFVSSLLLFVLDVPVAHSEVLQITYASLRYRQTEQHTHSQMRMQRRAGSKITQKLGRIYFTNRKVNCGVGGGWGGEGKQSFHD